MGPLIEIVVIQALGFGVGGIAAGSYAASYMSTYGGFAAAGSICAVLQSAGSVWLSIAMANSLFVAGASLATAVTEIVLFLMKTLYF